MSTLDLCEQYFGTRDVYELLGIPKDSLSKDIKKAYYKLSLQVHPDRVSDAEKKGATEKFKLLSKIYQILSDTDKRAIYDENGTIDDEDDNMENKLTSWLELWRKIFKPITVEDISNYQKEYEGSELERNDIKKAYNSGKGCINHMMNEVPFLKVEDEPRLQEIVRQMIDSGELRDYEIFTKEPAAKRNRRHKKYARESREAEVIKAKILAKNVGESNGGSLEQQIMHRQKSREDSYNSLLDKLMEKYGGEDDSEDYKSLGRRKANSKKKTVPKTPKSNKKNSNDAREEHPVRSGRVSKRK